MAIANLLLLLPCFLCLPSDWAVLAGKLHAINFRHPRLYPESFDWDEQHGHFVVGSITTGALVTVSDAGVLEDFIWDADYAGSASTLGIFVDSQRNRVLTVVHNTTSSPYAFDALAAYDLETKKRIFLARFNSRGEKAVANDVAVDYAGNAYVTNSAGNFVWKVNLQGEITTATSPLFSSQAIILSSQPGADCGLNGIVYDKRHYLLIGQSNSGSLFRVELESMAVRVIGLKQPLPGVDGIALRKDGVMVAVSTHTAWVVRSRDNWMSAEVLDQLPLDASFNTTAVAFRNSDHAYILHSYFEEFLTGRGTRETFSIQEIPLPRDWDVPMWIVFIIVLFVLGTSAWRFQLHNVIREARRKKD